MLESHEGGRYTRVTDNLFVDTARKGSPFLVRWKEAGKKKEKVLPLGTGEKAARRERDLIMKDDAPLRTATSRKTMQQVWDDFVAARSREASRKKLSANSLDKYEDHWLRPEIGIRAGLKNGTTKVGSVTPAHIEALITKMEASVRPNGLPYAPATVKSFHTALASLFTFAVKQGWIATSPVRGIDDDVTPVVETNRQSRRSKRIKPGELQRILEVLPSDSWRTITRFSVQTGMRPSEVLGLTWDQINEEEATICVDRQLSKDFRAADPTTWFVAPKGFRRFIPGHGRIVNLEPRTLAMLKAHRRENHLRGLGFSQLVFPARGKVGTVMDGKPTPIGQPFWGKTFVAAVEDARITRELTPHCLRHTYVSGVYATGTVPLDSIARQIGDSLATTENTYLDPDERGQRIDLYIAALGTASFMAV